MAQKLLNHPLLPIAKGGSGRNNLPAGLLTSSNLALGSIPPTPAGSVLKADGTLWAAKPGGKILQVVQGLTSTQVMTNGSAWLDTGLQVTITPLLADSKILLLITQSGVIKLSGSSNWLELSLWRDTTLLAAFGKVIGYVAPSNAAASAGSQSGSFAEQPNVITPVTYRTRMSCAGGGASGVVVQHGNAATSVLIAMEVAA